MTVIRGMRASSAVDRPSVDDGSQWGRVDVVELEPTLPAGAYETGGLEHVEVLRDRLPRRAQAVPHDQPRADLEQGLSVALDELVQDRSPRGIGKCLEHVRQPGDHRQADTCMSTRSGWFPHRPPAGQGRGCWP